MGAGAERNKGPRGGRATHRLGAEPRTFLDRELDNELDALERDYDASGIPPVRERRRHAEDTRPVANAGEAAQDAPVGKFEKSPPREPELPPRHPGGTPDEVERAPGASPAPERRAPRRQKALKPEIRGQITMAMKILEEIGGEHPEAIPAIVEHWHQVQARLAALSPIPPSTFEKWGAATPEGRGASQSLGAFYTIREAADLLGFDEATVRKYCIKGKIVGEKLGDHSWVIPRVELEAYMRRRGLLSA